MNLIVGATTEALTRSRANPNTASRLKLDLVLTGLQRTKSQEIGKLVIEEAVDLEDLLHRFIRMSNNRRSHVLVE